jgi:hypothetical protein
MIDGQKRSFMKFQDVRAFLDSVLDEDIHTKRVDSLLMSMNYGFFVLLCARLMVE